MVATGVITRWEHAAESLVPSPKTGLAVGIAGALLWQRHRILGLIAGMAIGSNASALITKDTRGMAIRNLVLEGAAVAGALLLENHPVFGFAGGAVAGGLAAPHVPGVAPWLV